VSANSLSVSISRTLLGAGTLVLPSTAHGFGHVGLSGVQWDRNFATSPWIDGRVLTSVRMQMKTLSVDLIAKAELTDPLTTLDTAVQALVDAVGQFAWTFSLAVGTSSPQVYSWACEPADYDLSKVEFSQGLQARIQVLSCTIPVMPRPIAGPL
jgi:hypothetical protein